MKKQLCIFFFTHFTYGMIFNVFGPIVPYLSQSISCQQSQFTYIFVVRGIAYLLAGFCQQSILKDYCLYKRMLSSCVISGIGFILFQLSYSNWLLSAGICFVMNFANGSIQILINILLVSAVKEDSKQAIGFSYGFYGIGAVMGSMIVSFLGINALMFCGIWIFAIGMMYFDLITFKESQNQGITLSSEQLQKPINQKILMTKIKATLPQWMQRNFYYLFLLYPAVSLTFRIWLPSFIVMQGLATKQTAAISISLYSGVLTLCRFIFTFWGPDIVKSLNYISISMIVALIGSLTSYYMDWDTVIIFGSSVVLGVLFASYVPFLYALPSEFNMVFSQQGVSNTIIYYAIGQAVISAFIGCLMQWFHPIMLFYALLVLSVFNYFIVYKTISDLSNYKHTNTDEIQLRQISS